MCPKTATPSTQSSLSLSSVFAGLTDSAHQRLKSVAASAEQDAQQGSEGEPGASRPHPGEPRGLIVARRLVGRVGGGVEVADLGPAGVSRQRAGELRQGIGSTAGVVLLEAGQLAATVGTTSNWSKLANLDAATYADEHEDADDLPGAREIFWSSMPWIVLRTLLRLLLRV